MCYFRGRPISRSGQIKAAAADDDDNDNDDDDDMIYRVSNTWCRTNQIKRVKIIKKYIVGFD